MLVIGEMASMVSISSPSPTFLSIERNILSFFFILVFGLIGPLLSGDNMAFIVKLRASLIARVLFKIESFFESLSFCEIKLTDTEGFLGLICPFRETNPGMFPFDSKDLAFFLFSYRLLPTNTPPGFREVRRTLLSEASYFWVNSSLPIGSIEPKL